ncbi:MAG: hypothetical protein LUD74_05600 [Tannerellaceae bacterium]|nr:hypothetical protein [Tannerellaceae bacterium]
MNVRMYYLVMILLVCSPVFTNAQIITIENGFSFAKAPNLFEKFTHPYQMSAGIEYMDKGWYNLTSNIGFLKKGGEDKLSYGEIFDAESYKWWLTARYLTLNTTFDMKAYTYDDFILYFAVGPRVDILLKATDYLKLPEAPRIQSSSISGLNSVMWGLKCGIGVKKQVGNLQLGLNAAWLPSFNRMYSTKVEGIHMKDRTFSVGVSMGYILNRPKGETIYSVKKHRARNRPE